MKEFIKAHKVRIWTIIIITIIVGIAGIFGLYKATQWTNAHTISWRTPVQKPWVITKKGEEAAKAQELQEQVKLLMDVVNKQGDWIASVDREVPESLKVSPQGK